MLVIDFDRETCQEAGRRTIRTVEELAEVLINATECTWIEEYGFVKTKATERVLYRVGGMIEKVIREMADREEGGGEVCVNPKRNGRKATGRSNGDARIVPERGRSWRRR